MSDIWSTYLTKFIARYGGRKLERARDLFEQALDGCPPKYAKSEAGGPGRGGVVWGRAPASDRPPPPPRVSALYLLYAQLEEEWGLARHAMAVYERATRAVEPAQQYDMFNIYIKRAAEIYGVTHTRGIYQKAIEVPCGAGRGTGVARGLSVPPRMGPPGAFRRARGEGSPLTPCPLLATATQVLSDEHAREMCLRFADMECKLGEIDRARAIYSFCSQICDPRVGRRPGRAGGQ